MPLPGKVELKPTTPKAFRLRTDQIVEEHQKKEAEKVAETTLGW